MIRLPIRFQNQVLRVALLCSAFGVSAMPATADEKTPYPKDLPTKDLRAAHAPYTLDTRRPFPEYKTLAEWQTRRAYIRNHILVNTGLTPAPKKTPLKAHVFGKVERDGYTIEKVSIQTYPGFYLAGNLYRPSKAEAGKKHPAILIAHGHWSNGRMANAPEGSIAARAITFARQGYVAFTYDMIGYNDTHQVDHRFANTDAHWLWGVSVMGIQTWNSIRSLDFLCSLSDVDISRLAISGESGGGTQTMMLGAIEDRLAATAPCVMVSHTMQGGCICENAPNLRQDFYNVEVAAVSAPRPQIIVGATGDWTTTTLTHEGPGLAHIYQLFGKPENEKHVIFDFGHNINETSRNAVYGFLGRVFLGEQDANKLKEPPYTKEPDEALRVFPDNTPLPSDAKNAEQMTEYLKRLGQEAIESRKPKDMASLKRFQKLYRTIWEHTLCVEVPKKADLQVRRTLNEDGRFYEVGRSERGDNIPVTVFTPTNSRALPAVVLVSTEGAGAFKDAMTGNLKGDAKILLDRGYTVVLADLFLTGSRADEKALADRKKPFGEFFNTYNRTNLQERVQDILTVCAFAGSGKVVLWGTGSAGLWTILAGAGADALIADGAQIDLTNDTYLLNTDNYVPGLRRMGDIRTALTLVAPKPVLLYNTGSRFAGTDWVADVYRAIGRETAFHDETSALSSDAILEWLGKL
ncbi:MAG: hypothetical protein NT023_13540 [Armatimonadetes bacterium]|nr:hypothetical protein [Armatimonadota bacterium]